MRLKIILGTLFFSLISVQAQNYPSTLRYNDLILSGTNVLEVHKMARVEKAGFVFQYSAPQTKSVGKALLLSLLLPGAGEYYVGNETQGKIFLGAELLVWGSFLVNDFHANSLERSYKAYARQHAGITGSGYDEQYWIDVGKFDDIYAYNNRRANDRRVDDIYEETGPSFWQWDSNKNRFTYDKNRLGAVNIKNRDVYFFTAILINHIASGINAARLARKHNRSIAQSSFNYRFVVKTFQPDNNYFGLAISQSF